MENSESTINRVGRAMWTVWGYLTGAVGRYLSPEVTNEGNQNVHLKQEVDKEEEVINEITVKGGDQICGARVRAAAVQWEKSNAGADCGNDEEKAMRNTRVREKPNNIFSKDHGEKHSGDDETLSSDAKMRNNASTPREDLLACTNTAINNDFGLSKAEKDHLDGKGSKNSQEISSKPEDEKNNVESLFKVLSFSSPKENTLACTDTDINKDDFSKTKEDLLDGKRARNSNIAKKKKDLENLSKEFKEKDVKGGLGVTTVIQKVPVKKTEEQVDDQHKKEDRQRHQVKTEKESESIISQMQMVEGSSPPQLVEDFSGKSLNMDVSDQFVEVCKNFETTQMEDAETNQKEPDTLNEIPGNNYAMDRSLPTVGLSQSEPHIEHMTAGTRLATEFDISGLQRPNTDTIMTEQNVKAVVAKVKAGTGNQTDTENESEFKTRIVIEDMKKLSLQKQDLVDENMVNQLCTEEGSIKEKSQTDDNPKNECSLKMPLSLVQNVTPLDLESVREMTSSSLQELDKTDKTRPIMKIKANPTKQIDETYTIYEEESEIPSDDQLNHSPEFSGHFGFPVCESLTQSDTETNNKKYEILDKTKLQLTDDSVPVHSLYITSEANESSVCSIAKQLAKSNNNYQAIEPHNKVRVMSIRDELEFEQYESGLDKNSWATELSESMVFDNISKTRLGDQVNNDEETVPDRSTVRLTSQVKTSDMLVFPGTESAHELLETHLDTDTDIEEDITYRTVSLAEGVVKKVIDEIMKKSEEDSSSREKEITPKDVLQEELHQSYLSKELPDQRVNESLLNTQFSEIPVHIEPKILDSTLQKQNESQWINEESVGSMNTLNPESQTIRTKYALNDQNSKQEESFEAVESTFTVTTESAKDQTKTMDSKVSSETSIKDGCNCQVPVKHESAVETEFVALHIETLGSLSLSNSESIFKGMESQRDTDQNIEKCERMDSTETELKTTSLEVVEEIIMELVNEPDYPEEIAKQEAIAQSYIKEDSMPEKFLDQEVTKSLTKTSTKVKPVLPKLKEDLMQELNKMECANKTTVESTNHKPAKSVTDTKTESKLSVSALETALKVPTDLIETNAMLVDDTSETLVEDCKKFIKCIQDMSAVETKLHRFQMDMQVDIEQLKTTSLEVGDEIMREFIKESIDIEEVSEQKTTGQYYTKEQSVQEHLASKEVTTSLIKASFTKVKPLCPVMKDDITIFSMQELDKIECANEISIGSAEQTAKVTSMSKHEQAESESVETTFEVPIELVDFKAMILDDTTDTQLEDTPNKLYCIQDRSAFKRELHGPLMDVITGLIEVSDEVIKKAEFETVVKDAVSHQEISEQCYPEEKSADKIGIELDSKCYPMEYKSDTNISPHETCENSFKVPKESVPVCKPVFEDQPNKMYGLQPECLGPVKVPENESTLESLKIPQDFKPETEKQDRTDELQEENGSVVASVGVVDELKVALKKKSKTLSCKMEALEEEEKMLTFEMHVEERLSEIMQEETMDIKCKSQKIKGISTMKDIFPQLEKSKHMAMSKECKDKAEERHRPELKIGIKETAVDKKFPSSVFLPQQASFLDFTAQKSKIALRSPLIRPPKDPRTLINMASVEPLTLILPSQPSTFQRSVKEDASTQSKNIKGFKLPGLGAGLPALRKTEAGKRIKDEENIQVHPERFNAESHLTDECVHKKAVPDKPAKPKLTPPKHPGMGSPMMMTELKNKLKKNVKE